MPEVVFQNCRLCMEGQLVASSLRFSSETGKILETQGQSSAVSEEECEIIDLGGAIVAPGLLELQTNGMLGFHFTHYESEEQYNVGLERVSTYLISRGVTAFWATVPTVHETMYQKVLPLLRPRTYENAATLLGCHVEGPYLNPIRKGAHDETLFKRPDSIPVTDVYGQENLISSIRLVTLAPEIPGADSLISLLTEQYAVRVSMGHSDATFEDGIRGLASGAVAITHLFNAMSPLHHRMPGLPGLLSTPDLHAARFYDPQSRQMIRSHGRLYFSLIADLIHLHPATLAMAYRANPSRAMLITDSIELAGLPDGTYPGHAQISHSQTKIGNRVVIEGTDTLIGSCCALDECVINLVKSSHCTLAEAVKCASENIADMMELKDRGHLRHGFSADFAVLDDQGIVLETWVRGRRVWMKT